MFQNHEPMSDLSLQGLSLGKLEQVKEKKLMLNTTCFYAPGLKGPSGASSNWIVRLSVCLEVIPSRLQTKCNI